MSKSNVSENDYLGLIYLGTPITGLADNAASPLTTIYLSLHTSDPGEAGNQSTNEVSYTGYARAAVTRGAGFSLSGNTLTLAASVEFPTCTSGSGTITHFATGTASNGTGKILHSGPVSPTIAFSLGTTPRIDTSTSIVED